MVFIFFLYGLAFFSFGLALFFYPKNIKGVDFTQHLWLLAFFGVLHGITEWIDMFKLLENQYLPILNLINFVLLPISYLFLLLFALRSLKNHLILHYQLLLGSFLAIFAIALLNSDPLFLESNVWARYILGAPAIFLSAYVLYVHRKVHINKISFSLGLLVFIFILYAFLSTLIVPKSDIYLSSILNQELFFNLTGIPVQLFRTILAFAAAYLVIRILYLLRIQQERDLRKLSKALEVSADLVMITDKYGIIEYVNNAFVEQTGYTINEVLGKKPSFLRSGVHSENFYKNLWDVLLTGETYESYMVNKKKNGEHYHEYKAIAPIFDLSGEIINYISTGKDVTELILLEEELRNLATHDSLTGIANRASFDEFFQIAIARVERYDTELSIILFDIDNFKKINDNYGHLIGDEVLKSIVNIANDTIRKSDLIARWGGEEFMIIQTETSKNDAAVFAERLRKKIQDHLFEKIGKVTVSFGVTSFQKDDTQNSCLKRVDEALYTSKTTGKNKVTLL